MPAIVERRRQFSRGEAEGRKKINGTKEKESFLLFILVEILVCEKKRAWKTNSRINQLVGEDFEVKKGD